MTYETLILELGDPVSTLTLNRPDVLNALTEDSLGEFLDALRVVGEHEPTGALILTGAGRAFCAGADLARGPTAADPESLVEASRKAMMERYNPAVQALHELTVPTIAAVNGAVAGGGVGLALACDIVLAARSSRFVQVFVPQLGLIPDMGCTWQLPRRIGRARALGLAFFGDSLDAETAERWGLIWKCVDDDALMPEAGECARKLGGFSTAALVATRRAFDVAPSNSLAAQLALEVRVQPDLIREPAFMANVQRFLDKGSGR
jgi:2-(1,2-epoxy-1,2-dihydrophenyl)acetyl-CoA isomerase